VFDSGPHADAHRVQTLGAKVLRAVRWTCHVTAEMVACIGDDVRPTPALDNTHGVRRWARLGEASR
jgi:hypothetical protein